ncbi:MAG: ComEA family DNA-binding protein, partial [Brachybacterium sp.]|nr:ComEA family DNA-binding protein [Brachybacterium sp.]
LGVAVLLLIAGGAVHLSSRGTALDAPAAPDLGHAAEEAGELHPGDAAPTGGAGADGQPQEEQPQGELSGDGQGAAADEAGGVLIVHVTGAVATPGVVEIPPGARVHDAVEAAGGATGDADLAAVNLARAAVDGEQVHVPVPGEEPRDTPAGPPADGAEGADSDAAAPGRDEGDSAGGAVNLNTAGESELQELPGVGPAIAGRILEHREANGPFRSVDDLLEVSGIGPATLEKIREKATV